MNIDEKCSSKSDKKAQKAGGFSFATPSLNLFKSLWKIEVERRGKKAPRLIERYPSLVNRHPETLPGMQELKELSRNAVIIGTEDYCHHGVAYAIPKNSAIHMGGRALSFAQQHIENGFSLLQQNRYAEFYIYLLDMVKS